MSSRKTILIIENSAADRSIFKEMLQGEYEILEAENTKDGIRILKAHQAEVAAIFLQLQILKADNKKWAQLHINKSGPAGLPVLVAADEKYEDIESLCAPLGVWDFVAKPYSRAIVLLRLQHILASKKASLMEKACGLAERDKLTGLYNREYFMQQAKQMILSHPATTYSLVRMDIDRFRDFNAFFGSATGDKLLRTIAADIRSNSFEGQVYGRIESDVFCICTPYASASVEAFCERANLYAQKFQKNYFLKFSFGIYLITDPKMEMEQMYSHASEAAKKGKHETKAICTFYDEAMADRAARERQIIDEFDAALKQKQLEIYLQPQYSLLFGVRSGAEALVRWQHPERGLIMPGEFIPVLEKNGLISKLDKYMMENVCILLHKWLAEGTPTCPVSLNLSRISLYSPRMERTLCELTDQYHVPRSLIPIEITESAYTEEPERMTKMIDSLHQKGFVVEMDDFGSGYSSLNMLRALDVDVLKVDMRFLSANPSDVKSEKILASVLRMASWLGLPVVVEGVETKEQAEFLVSAGCQCVQGFYFAKPMPVSQYEQSPDSPPVLTEINSNAKAAANIGKAVSEHMSAGYTAHEMRAMLSLLSAVFDLVRVVEPEDAAVITFLPDDTIRSEPYICFKFLGRSERCENCTSLCALQGQCVLAKYELIDKNVFYFTSRPLKITMFDGSDKNLVLEVASRITDESEALKKFAQASAL